MQLRITIDLGNDAFQSKPKREISRILEDLVRRMSFGRRALLTSINLYDINGNHCGTATLEDAAVSAP
jgi:hypothetical protein